MEQLGIFIHPSIHPEREIDRHPFTLTHKQLSVSNSLHLHVFRLSQTQGEHANFTQKGPGWNLLANHCTTRSTYLFFQLLKI